MWLLDCLPEVRSDLSVFHRVEEMEQMDSVRFCQLAPLLGAYPGAVAARHRPLPVDPAGVVSEPSPVRPVPDRPRYATPAPPPGARVVESSRAALAMSPLADMFSFATVGG